MAEEDEVTRAEALARSLDRPMGALGVLFLLVVLGQTVAEHDAVLTLLSVAGWVLWAAFVAEFALRAYVARSRRRFWRRNWWQLVFLALPFLRLVRLLLLVRVARIGGILSAAIRGSRSAGRLLSGRIAWLSVVTAVVILASSQLLYVVGAYDSYRQALHDAAMSTIVGEPLSQGSGSAQILEVALAVYSVGVFAVLAASLGAYFLERGPGGAGAPQDGGHVAVVPSAADGEGARP